MNCLCSAILHTMSNYDYRQYLKYRPVNCLSIKLTINYQKHLSCAVSKNVCSKNFLRIIIKASVPELLSVKFLAFSWWMRQQQKYYYLRRILFQTFKQHPDYKSIIVKMFDGNASKVKTTNPNLVGKNKKQCFLFFLDRMRSWIYSPAFCVPDQVRNYKIKCNEVNLFRPVRSNEREKRKVRFEISNGCR